MIEPGESVCVCPRIYHQFWAAEGSGLTLGGEVSRVCNDFSDNVWLEPRERFPQIEQDEPPRHVMCNEYGK